MKRFFYIGALLLVATELFKTYLVMPMPGSQGLDLVGLAHFLYQWRWPLRVILGLGIAVGLRDAWRGRKWLVITTSVLVVALVGVVNLVMTAERMFLQPSQVVMAGAADNQVDPSRLILGVEHAGEYRAYPIQYIAHHHQVLDTVGGKPLIITYCSVCRTGRAFEPIVEGKQTTFRLVGMDHWNAMLEDAETGTWWRQANGEAVAGSLRGQTLPEWPVVQMELGTWLRLHPKGRVMQPDPLFEAEYAGLADYEAGRRQGGLTGTDTTAWARKSWVVGIEVGDQAKAYDWHHLLKSGLVEDVVGDIPILIVAAGDGQRFYAYQRPANVAGFSLRGDTLMADTLHYDLEGNALNGGADLQPLPAYQEFWHSWQTFHPTTQKGE